MTTARLSHTHVMAVGVSTYAAVGASWKLEAAADHAVQFAEWAHAAGVPPANIHLFLSTADHERFEARLKVIRVVPGPATMERILAFSMRDLPELSGDLLYFYWSGHGSVIRNSQQLLFYEEQKRSAYIQFNFDEFLAQLRSTGSSSFSTQIFYVDACANAFERLGLRGQPGSHTWPQGIGRSDVKQVWLRAADSGAQAAGGAFSKVLLEELTRRFSADKAWPVAHDAIVAAVEAALIGHATAVGVQRPVEVAWVSSKGSSQVQTRGEVPAEEFVNTVAGSCGLPVQALRRLAESATEIPSLQKLARRDDLFRALAAEANILPEDRGPRADVLDLDLLYIVASAFYWQQQTADGRSVLARLEAELSGVGATSALFAKELGRARLIRDVQACLRSHPIASDALRQAYLQTIETLPKEPERVHAAGLVAMLDRLVQLPPKDELPFSHVWEFLLRLADYAPGARTAIEALVNAPSVDQLALEALRTNLRHERRYLLSILVQHAAGQEMAPAHIESNLLVTRPMARVKPFPPVETHGSWAVAREAVASIVKEARKEVFSRLSRDERPDDRMDVEFVLNHAFFPIAPDRFGVALPITPCPLGRVHPVVIRWIYRVQQPWLIDKPWFTISARVDRRAQPKVQWLERQGVDELAACAEGCDGLLALSFVPDTDAIVSVLDAGFPFVAWPRNSADERGWDKFRKDFDDWATHTPRFDELPRALRSIRNTDTALGSDMTLLWDDPDYASCWLTQPEVINE